MKRKPFTLKSGNTVPFKQMGSSPVLQQADATLVAAAKAAAMANVPKDFSAQYNKTAEGVIAAQKGKTEMITKIAQEAPGIITGVARGIDKTVGKIKSRVKGRKELKETFALTGLDKPSKEDFKSVRKAADQDFEQKYREKHKDRKSIKEIREMTGAIEPTKKGKGKDTTYRDLYKEKKAKNKLEKLLAEGKVTEKTVTDDTTEEASTADKPAGTITTEKASYAPGETPPEDENVVDRTSYYPEEKENKEEEGGGGEEEGGGGEEEESGSESGSATKMKRSVYKMKYSNSTFPFKK